MISYYDITNQYLKLATRSIHTLTWTLETVDSATEVGQYNSLAFSPNGQPAISYYDANLKTLKFASKPSSTWVITTVDTGLLGQYTSLAYAPDGHPSISYYAAGTADLKYAHYNGTTWNLENVDSSGLVGAHTSLAFGPDGQPAVTYYDIGNTALKIARKGPFTPPP